MTLTVPQAGTNPGRVARAQEEPVNQTGAALAGLGQRMEQIGSALETDFLERQYQRTQIDATRDLNNLRLEVSAIGDPDAAEQRWIDGRKEIRARYLGPENDEDGGEDNEDGGALHVKNRDRFTLAYDQLANSHEYSLGRQTLVARQAQHEANYIDYAHTATQQAATAAPEVRDELLTNGLTQIDRLVELGIINAAEGKRRKIGLQGDFDNARAITMVDEDPEGFLAATEAGEFKGLEADRIAQYQKQARASVERAAAAAAKSAEAERMAAEGVLDDEISEIEAIYSAGGTPANAAPAMPARPPRASCSWKRPRWPP